jgi:hypothetical protein
MEKLEAPLEAYWGPQSNVLHRWQLSKLISEGHMAMCKHHGQGEWYHN